MPIIKYISIYHASLEAIVKMNNTLYQFDLDQWVLNLQIKPGPGLTVVQEPLTGAVCIHFNQDNQVEQIVLRLTAK